MTISGEHIDQVESDSSHQNQVADMAPLVKRMREFLDERQNDTVTSTAPYDTANLVRRFGFTDKKKGKPEIIVKEDVARELGHPSTASRAMVLLTFQPEKVCHGQISILGPDVDAMVGGEGYPLAQVVILAIDPDQVPDPYEMENTQFLMNRLPGYMVRSVPGKLWVRISKKGRTAGLTLKAVGSALIAAYVNDFKGVEKAEIIFVTRDKRDVDALGPVAAEADILAGRHKKLVLGLDGEVECTELNCETCEEKPVCDDLRDIVIKRRRPNK